MKKFMMFCVALALGFQSCDNNDDLWGAIDDLKSRVQALETQVEALNGNVAALQKLYSGATISSVTEDPDTGDYTLTLSDGKTYVLRQGSEAEAVIPQIGIDATTGFWQVRYSDTEAWQSLGVKAAAVDGKTPQFRIEENTGCWQVRYADTEEWGDVLDNNGQPVKAVGDATITDKFFDAVALQGDEFYVKLLDGTELRVPVVKDFVCRIVVDSEGEQKFDAGETRRFKVELKGAVNTIVTAPEGWSARLSDADELIVTAPGAAVDALSRAAADTSKDVAILATSAAGFSAIAKIQVASSGVAPVPPTVSVALSTTVDATETTLTFDVTLSSNADGWKYICLKSTEQAPADAAAIAANGTSGSGTSVTVTDLTSGTAYTIYVVAYRSSDPVVYSQMAQVAGTTAVKVDQNDYYTTGVEIGGVRYDKSSTGAKLVELAADAVENDKTFSVNAGGVFFLDDKSETFSIEMSGSQGVTKDVIVVGRNAKVKSKLRIPRYWGLRNESATLAFKNLKIDARVSDNYLFNASGGAAYGLKTLLFEDCEITLDKILLTMYNADTGVGVENIVFRNCKLRFENAETTYNLITLQKLDAGLSKFKTLVFENNILYSTQATAPAMSLLLQENATATLTGSLSNLAVTCRNNTFVNCISYGNNSKGYGTAYFYVGKIGSVEFTHNLLYTTMAKYIAVMRVAHAYGDAWPAIDLHKEDNKVYGGSGWKPFFDTNKPASITWTSYPKLTEDPLSTCDISTGKFVKTASVAGYGSTLE